MDKVFIIQPDNNKGKYITNGYASAFSDFNYFIFERKIFDLNVEEIAKIQPHVVFCFWSDIVQNEALISFFEQISCENIDFIHVAEVLKDIPVQFRKKSNHFCFSSDNKDKKYFVNMAINAKDYKVKFDRYKYTIAFAGNPALDNREEILANLIYNFGPINIFCRSFDFYKSLDDMHKNNLLNDNYLELYRASYQGYVENQKELASIYSSSKINIDMPNIDGKNMNYRTLEVLASNGFLLTPYNDLVVKQFDDGKDIETYKNPEQLVDKINFYLKNLNLAQSIAYNGKKNAVSNHSFCDRLKSILKVIYGEDFSNR